MADLSWTEKTRRLQVGLFILSLVIPFFSLFVTMRIFGILPISGVPGVDLFAGTVPILVAGAFIMVANWSLYVAVSDKPSLRKNCRHLLLFIILAVGMAPFLDWSARFPDNHYFQIATTVGVCAFLYLLLLKQTLLYRLTKLLAPKSNLATLALSHLCNSLLILFLLGVYVLGQLIKYSVISYQNIPYLYHYFYTRALLIFLVGLIVVVLQTIWQIISLHQLAVQTLVAGEPEQESTELHSETKNL